MSITTQDLQDLSRRVFTPSALDRNFPFTDETLSIPQVSDNVDPLSPPIPEPIDSASYSEGDYDWLVNALEALIKFIHRDENWSIPELEENDYAWAHALLVELVGAVGESETHPLRPLMEFVCQLIDNYEDKYVPELTELFPELAEEAPIETAKESKQPASDIPKQSDSELAAHAFFSIGYLLYHGHRVEKAISAYDTATALKPDSWEASYNLGIAQYDLRQYAEAMVNFNKAIELNPNFASAYYNRGILKSELKDYEGAIADFNKAIILKPDHVEAYNNRGIAKSKLNLHESAIADFDKVIGLHPKHANGYYNRGLGNNKIGNHQAAIDDFNKAINLNPNDAEAYYNRGYTNYQLGNHQTVIDDFDKAIELKPDIAECHYYRGVVKKRLGNFQDAITDFNKAIELGLNSAEVYLNRADAKGESGQHNDALADYIEAIEIKPDYAEVYYNRGNLKQKHEQHDDALADYTEAIQIKPDFAEAYHNRGSLKRELGQYDAALADYTEAIRIKPDYAMAYYNRGVQKVLCEKFDAAIVDFTEVIRIKPDYAEAYANLGIAKVGLDRIDEARRYFQKALELGKRLGNNNLTDFVENQLQQLNQEASKQNDKEPRRGGQMQTHIVTRVIDGDTLEVSPEISRRVALQTPMERLIGAPLPAETPTERLSRPNMFHKIRLRNIDAPEIGTPQSEKAIHYLKQLLEGKRVTFKPAGISYDRVVADVWRYPDHVFVNAIMVYSGHAKWSHPPR